MIKNKKRFFNKLDKHVDDSQAHVKRAIARSAIYVQGVAQKGIMAGIKSGTTVTKYNPSRAHQQSAAGEMPASDTGFLVGSISHRVRTKGKTIIGEVVASAEYAIHLEFGTTDMQARPFLQPALDQSKAKIVSIFKQEGLIR
tara:strand:+ start:6947 stop:7372 length:426 start_codon:yes stop_codon:yes gene_type:complete